MISRVECKAEDWEIVGAGEGELGRGKRRITGLEDRTRGEGGVTRSNNFRGGGRGRCGGGRAINGRGLGKKRGAAACRWLQRDLRGNRYRRLCHNKGSCLSLDA
ncbi:hypothetical protein AMTR_s00028p00074940 [Amborella trichopoda]|uniref:Uncharacterized protein n=1 Tax=Amborella trichopoda TaxID=13333 RepID=W1PR83_AMBTC|nr:hypothetical protein AMTR_s00028p00074940 [Amborella trichopoda]